MISSRPEQITFQTDSFRQSADGVFQPLFESVFLIVAIHFFNVGDFWKGLISASSFIGFLLTAPLNNILGGTAIPRRTFLSCMTAVAGCALLAAAFAPSGITFALSAAAAAACINIRQPFFTDLYGAVYPAEHRARRISLGLRLNLLISLAAGLLYGSVLDRNMDLWRVLMALCVVIISASALMLMRLPENSVRSESKARPFRNPVFLYVQAAWTLFGFANIFTIPLKAVYLAEAERGLGLPPSMVTIVLVVIPVAARFLFNPVWARLYHRLSFPLLRILINTFFMISIPLFFMTDRLPVIILATVLNGFGSSGSPFIWQLWVTRIARPQEIKSYQSAHAFLAGIRGILAPFAGLALLKGMSFAKVGMVSGAIIFAATLMILPLLRSDRRF